MMRIDDFVNLVKSGQMGPMGQAAAEDTSRLCAQFIKELKKYSPADLEAAYGGFDFNKHSHGMVAVLGAKAANPACAVPQTLQQVEAFLTACSAGQTLPRTLDAHQIYIMCLNVAERLIHDKSARLGVDLMLRAIGLIQENLHQLTEIHYLLLWLCLESKHYKPAIEMLETSFYEVVPTKNFDLHACIMYYFYGSVILSTHKFFISALHYLSTIFLIPGVATSSGQVASEAFKKYILLSMLAKDQGLGLPRSVVSQLETHLRKNVGPYLVLQEEFYSDTFDVRAFEQVVEKHAVAFAQDRNMGLIRHVIKRYKTKELLKFAKVFENMELSVVMDRIAFADRDELESHLLDMYSYSDQIGSVDEKKGAIFFTKKTNSTSADQIVAAIQTSVADMQNTVDILASVEVEILSDPEFLRRTVGHGTDGGRDGMSREDVMAIAEALNSPAAAASANGSSGSRSGRRAM